MIEALPIVSGQFIRLVIDMVQSPWRQGVWLGTDGVLRVADSADSQFVVWSDTAPAEVRIQCESTDGLLRFYNVWDSHRGYQPYESQSATSGMLVEELDDGWIRYSCNDIGANPDFQKLVFRIAVI